MNAKVRNGSDIVVKRGRLLRLTIDGKEVDVWTTAPTVADALAELGYERRTFPRYRGTKGCRYPRPILNCVLQRR